MTPKPFQTVSCAYPDPRVKRIVCTGALAVPVAGSGGAWEVEVEWEEHVAGPTLRSSGFASAAAARQWAIDALPKALEVARGPLDWSTQQSWASDVSASLTLRAVMDEQGLWTAGGQAIRVEDHELPYADPRVSRLQTRVWLRSVAGGDWGSSRCDVVIYWAGGEQRPTRLKWYETTEQALAAALRVLDGLPPGGEDGPRPDTDPPAPPDTIRLLLGDLD